MTDDKLRAALDATDEAACRNCTHAADLHSPVNEQLCAAPGCACQGLDLTNRVILNGRAASATDERPPGSFWGPARPAVPALDGRAVQAALPDMIFGDGHWEWSDGTVAWTQDDKASVITAKIVEYAALHSEEPTDAP